MKNLSAILLIVIVGLTCLWCSNSTQSNPPDNPDPLPVPSRSLDELTADEISLLESINKFGLKLFREIADNTPAGENIFISPLSVSYALGMCNNGADGETREAIKSTLEIAGLTIEEINQAYHDLTQILVHSDPLVEFSSANSFWSRLGKAIEPKFKDLVTAYFKARVEEIDFQAPGAADTINAWVNDATNGKITEMIKPPISPAVSSILMNAIYFKGSWMFPFDTAYTRESKFTLADGSETDCQMMYLPEKDHAVQVNEWSAAPDTNATSFRNQIFSAVSLPYGRGDFRMTIMVPNEGWNKPDNTVEDIIAELTWENWTNWLGNFYASDFNLHLPKFKFEYDTDLVDVLKTLGMEIAFDPSRADFGNMFTDGVGWLDKAKQKTFIQVDEKGTEAAAVTALITQDCLSLLEANRPFLIVIHEDVSGAILFIGKIADPVWEE